jgi:hypothetical protein
VLGRVSVVEMSVYTGGGWESSDPGRVASDSVTDSMLQF